MNTRTIATAASIATLSMVAAPIAAAATTSHAPAAKTVHVDRSRDAAGVRHVDRTRDVSAADKTHDR